MRYVQLRAFHYVAIHGGFSRAAEALFLTQPAISDQVRKLEEEYDVLLINRQRKQISLTKAGEELLEITNRFFEVENQALEFLSESVAFSTGTLRIKVDSTFHVLSTLKKFRERFPKIRIEIKTGNSFDVVQSLLNYDADVGVLGTLPSNSNIDIIKLGRSPIIAFVSKNNPLTQHTELSIAELNDLPLVMREPNSRTRQKIEDAAKSQGIELSPIIEAEGREAVQEIVGSGTGIGFVSEKEFPDTGTFAAIKISGAAIEMEEAVVSLKERSGSKLIRAFVGMVQETLRENTK